jgi:hypothetical protein
MSLSDDEEVTWERVIEESHKKPDDPIAQMFMGVDARIKKLERPIRCANCGNTYDFTYVETPDD